MNIMHRRVKMHTLKGDMVEVKLTRLLRIRAAISSIRLWLAKLAVPHGWTVVDEADVSYFTYLKDEAKSK